MTRVVQVQSAAFDAGTELARLTDGRTDIGGLAAFIGVVRGQDEGGTEPPIVALTLEHYPGMTEIAIGRIVDEAMARWSLIGCTVIHRIGRLVPGDPIVLTAAASSHRAASLEACAFLIDWLKTRAPFWKLEELGDGSRRWVEARTEDAAAAARWSGAL